MRKSRISYMRGLLSAFAVRLDAWLAVRHLRDGCPQIAIFAFDHIGARVNTFGRYEQDELHALREFLMQHGLTGGACLDIGANVGNHSLFFSGIYSEVHAFEPLPRTFSLLEHNAALADNIHCHNVGLSDGNRRAGIAVDALNIGAGSLKKSESATQIFQVDLVRLDDFQPVRGIKLGLIKIDVEGHERAVLDGAARILSESRPAIVFEQQAEEMHGGSSQVIERLQQLGYRHFFEFVRVPQTPFRVLTILLRSLIGEWSSFKPVGKFEPKYYGMLVALP